MDKRTQIKGNYNIVLQDIHGSTINITGASLHEVMEYINKFSSELENKIDALNKNQIKRLSENIQRLENLINDSFSPLSPDEFEEDVSRLTKGFYGRESERVLIKEFIQNNNRGTLFLFGSPGIGKSALVAKAYSEMLRDDAIINENIIIPYFIRRGTETAQVQSFYSYMNQQIETTLDTGIPIANNVEGLRSGLHQRLREASHRLGSKKLVFMIDGLDEGQPKELLNQLSASSYENVLIIYASRYTSDVEDLKYKIQRLGPYSEKTLTGLEKEVIIQILNNICERHPFPRALYPNIIENSQGNPKYFESLEHSLRNKIISLNAPADVPIYTENFENFYAPLLKRYIKQDHGEDIMSCLYALTVAKDYLNDIQLSEINNINSTAVSRAIFDLNEVLIEKKDKKNTSYYQIFHESLREFIIDRAYYHIVDAKFELTAHCKQWREYRRFKFLQEYPIKYYSDHLLDLIEYEEDEQSKEELYLLAEDEEYRNAQITLTKQYLRSFDVLKSALKVASLEGNNEGAIQIGIKALKLHALALSKDSDFILWSKEGSSESLNLALNRITSFESKQQIEAYFILLYNLLFGTNSNRLDKVESLAAIIKHLDKTLDRSVDQLPFKFWYPIIHKVYSLEVSIAPLLGRLKLYGVLETSITHDKGWTEMEEFYRADVTIEPGFIFQIIKALPSYLAKRSKEYYFGYGLLASFTASLKYAGYLADKGRLTDVEKTEVFYNQLLGMIQEIPDDLEEDPEKLLKKFATFEGEFQHTQIKMLLGDYETISQYVFSIKELTIKVKGLALLARKYHFKGQEKESEECIEEALKVISYLRHTEGRSIYDADSLFENLVAEGLLSHDDTDFLQILQEHAYQTGGGFDRFRRLITELSIIVIQLLDDLSPSYPVDKLIEYLVELNIQETLRESLTSKLLVMYMHLENLSAFRFAELIVPLLQTYTIRYSIFQERLGPVIIKITKEGGVSALEIIREHIYVNKFISEVKKGIEELYLEKKQLVARALQNYLYQVIEEKKQTLDRAYNYTKWGYYFSIGCAMFKSGLNGKKFIEKAEEWSIKARVDYGVQKAYYTENLSVLISNGYTEIAENLIKEVTEKNNYYYTSPDTILKELIKIGDWGRVKSIYAEHYLKENLTRLICKEIIQATVEQGKTDIALNMLEQLKQVNEFEEIAPYFIPGPLFTSVYKSLCDHYQNSLTATTIEISSELKQEALLNYGIGLIAENRTQAALQVLSKLGGNERQKLIFALGKAAYHDHEETIDEWIEVVTKLYKAVIFNSHNGQWGTVGQDENLYANEYLMEGMEETKDSGLFKYLLDQLLEKGKLNSATKLAKSVLDYEARTIFFNRIVRNLVHKKEYFIAGHLIDKYLSNYEHFYFWYDLSITLAKDREIDFVFRCFKHMASCNDSDLHHKMADTYLEVACLFYKNEQHEEVQELLRNIAQLDINQSDKVEKINAISGILQRLNKQPIKDSGFFEKWMSAKVPEHHLKYGSWILFYQQDYQGCLDMVKKIKDMSLLEDFAFELAMKNKVDWIIKYWGHINHISNSSPTYETVVLHLASEGRLANALAFLEESEQSLKNTYLISKMIGYTRKDQIDIMHQFIENGTRTSTLEDILYARKLFMAKLPSFLDVGEAWVLNQITQELNNRESLFFSMYILSLFLDSKGQSTYVSEIKSLLNVAN